MTEQATGETEGREEVIFLHAAVNIWRRLSTSAMMLIKGVLRSCDWRVKTKKGERLENKVIMVGAASIESTRDFTHDNNNRKRQRYYYLQRTTLPMMLRSRCCSTLTLSVSVEAAATLSSASP